MMLVSVAIRRKSTAAPAPMSWQVPASGVFVRVLHDFQTAFWDLKPRGFAIGFDPLDNPDGAFPDTFRLASVTMGEDITIALSEPLQRLWYALLRLACHDLIPAPELLLRWAEITEHGRALTDGFAVQQGYRDFVLGVNPNAKPIRQKMLTMGGNILKVLGETSTHYIVETIDPRAVPAPAEVWGKPWLVHWGTQTSVVKTASGWRVTDWGQLNWAGVGYGVPFLVLSDTGMAKVRKVYCEPIANGAVFSPYG